MRKNINSKWGIFLALTILSITWMSCEKFLDRKPLGQLTEDDLQGGSFDAQVFGAYGKMRAWGITGLPYIMIHNTRSDDADKGSSTSDGVDAENFFDNFQYGKDFWLLNGYWTDHYALIIETNRVISNIDSLGAAATPPTLINRAEAKFMRAYAYFNLVRAFGRVPKIDFKITDPAQANIKKVQNESEIFALIDADLMEASTVLPLSWDARYTGRLTKGAANGLKARAHLFRSQWAPALAAAKEVINSNVYNLNTPYDRIFREEGENSSESVFEIQALYTQTQNLGIQYAQVQGVRGAGAWDLGWGWNTPNVSLVNEFEAGDPRKDATLLYSGQVNSPYGENVPPATSNVPRNWWNKKVYTNPAVRQATNSRFGQWMNLRVIRYADVLLMAAEAANELGGAQNMSDARMWLEMVRARARGGNASVLPAVTTTDQAALRAAIHHERRVELGMENERFFDLVRWGIVEQVMHAAGKTGYQAKHRYLPIPQPEIDKSNGVLEQNPDYQ